VIDRCLAKQPAARYASGGDVAAAIGRAMAEYASPPLEVRAFMVESRHLSAPALGYGIVTGLAVPLLAIAALTAERPAHAVVAGFGIAWTLFLPVAYMYQRVRRLRLAGFGRHDLIDAIEAELGRRREETAFLYGAGPSRLERALRAAAYVATGLVGALTWLAVRAPDLVPVSALSPAFWGPAGVAVLMALGARARTEHRTDPKGERRRRFWRGPLGRALFHLAGLGLGRGSARRAETPPPASAPASPDLSVGIVGERFFQAPVEHPT
jgi:hypothetical protein